MADASHDPLFAGDDFARRHIGPSEAEIARMLASLGVDSLDALVERALPPTIRSRRPLALPPPLDERAALEALSRIAERNRVFTSLIGMGYHPTHTPAVIRRHVLENPAWYTAYTPYQPEISQGRLEGLLIFQQMVCDLTGMEMANASLLDEATAAAEAMAMARRVAPKGAGERFFVDADCHPQTLAVVTTRARYLGFEVVVGDPTAPLPQGLFGALIQYPGSRGAIPDLADFVTRVHAAGALAVVATDLLALALLTAPGEVGADIAVGSTQRFGVPMGYGGPHAAFFAFREAHKRAAPGRIIGVSVDRRGRPALRMALQTREQHIRREKATSNICTSQVLLALVAAFYAVWHGPEGIRRIAERTARLADHLAAGLKAAGWRLENDSWFDTLTVATGERTEAIYRSALAREINLRRLPDALGISLNELSTPGLVAELLELFAAPAPDFAARPPSGIPERARRRSSYLTHPVFADHRGEAEMARFLKRLEARDFSLVHGMIPLGSCTMKLNAAAELFPLTWPQFADLHPFAPAEQAAGYRQLFAELEAMLAEITGFDAVSLQPNAGSQGEYAGLVAIRRYHESRGEDHRDLCLIPASAHGTNPASARLAGLQVLVVRCDAQGNVDLADLDDKLRRHGERVAALMLTYPSTHGVFEEAVAEICARVHAAGGQVYLDGANLNALVGLARPAELGADVCHLNLHKTFAIPHGGGGPGMGPIAVARHLAPFLPSHPVTPPPGTDPANGTVSAAAWGSALILTIPWLYLRMMGAAGLVRATQVAILNANYLARRLGEHYPVLYTGRDGLVAHECILDLRPLREATGISEEDVAKRLADYGFHAPTMSFPVPGTLMIEPTESENLAELDRFVEAMAQIRTEIEAVAQSRWPADDNPLVNAPHTLEDLLDDPWPHPYDRARAVCPTPWARRHKYWPAVNRVDNVRGDRQLFCACPPPEVWADLE
ncbi:MAG: glycine dehydrogenase (decarboxylating) 2 [Porticoccaceae bacterium]|nr:MAG: glycine dehydrogenase (decarboxylating) 2 [Porticoccaceae bacterium]